ncbi:uncharacterized protein LOC124952838 [Vespa velutina]|uniref:uncharacterized protein LOC124952838 n=1 Tax=Vespa velutina TaxID=202808 RepID=UPI001FB39CF8|nr:uncharacterized protein LOC124952838 [Vespa velutina]
MGLSKSPAIGPLVPRFCVKRVFPYSSGWKYLVISKPDRQLGPNTDQSTASYQTRQDPFADWDVQLHYRVVVPNTNEKHFSAHPQPVPIQWLKQRFLLPRLVTLMVHQGDTLMDAAAFTSTFAIIAIKI